MTDVLSSEEIDRLLTAIDVEIGGPEGVKPAVDCRRIRIYDFKRPDKFTKEQIRVLSIIHERFARELTALFAAYFRKDTHVHVVSVDQMSYEEFTRCIPTPSALAVINSELNGASILEIDPAVSRAMLNRLFGGNGETEESHELTALEMKVMKDLIDSCVLKPLQDAWENVIDLRPVLTAIETTPQFVQIAPSCEMTVLITFECGLGEAEGMINLCIPYQTIRPVVNRLSAQWWYSRREERKEKSMETPFHEAVGQIQIPVTVQLGKAMKTLNDVRSIGEGTIIELDNLAGEPCAVYAGNVLIGRGEVVVIDEKFGIRITEVTGGGNG
jgi:flagellar motor switch protein FliM